MIEASVRTADRLIVQFGTGPLGAIDGCVVHQLTEAQATALRAAIEQPHSRLYFAVDGAITLDPPDPPAEPTAEQQAELDAFEAVRATVVAFVQDAEVDAFLGAAKGSAAITLAQRDAIQKRTIRALRALARATRRAISELQ